MVIMFKSTWNITCPFCKATFFLKMQGVLSLLFSTSFISLSLSSLGHGHLNRFKLQELSIHGHVYYFVRTNFFLSFLPSLSFSSSSLRSYLFHKNGNEKQIHNPTTKSKDWKLFLKRATHKYSHHLRISKSFLKNYHHFYFTDEPKIAF